MFGRGEGGSEGANGVVAGLSEQKINALMNKKGSFSPKKHTPPVTKIWPFCPQIDSISRGGLRYLAFRKARSQV